MAKCIKEVFYGFRHPVYNVIRNKQTVFCRKQYVQFYLREKEVYL